jgi:hypothetical protein
MKYFLQTGFGEPIGHQANELVKSLDFDGCRVGAPRSADYSLAAIIQEVEDAGLEPLIVVSSVGEALLVPPGIPVEYLNEPDLTSVSPEVYARDALTIQRARGRCWAGCISNLNDRGLAYLTKVLAAAPELERISVHRYPRPGGNVHKAHAGFDSREFEVEALKRIVGDRAFGVSEFGYHTGKDSWWRPRLTDYQVAERVEWEWRFWRRMGAEFATLYQINDGITNTRLDRYGIRRRTADNGNFNGPLKNVANSVRRVKEKP